MLEFLPFSFFACALLLPFLLLFVHLVVGEAPSPGQQGLIKKQKSTGHHVLILDFGSQYTQLIARRVREEGMYSHILPCSAALERIEAFAPQALILSGGPSSVYDEKAPKMSQEILDYCREKKVLVLGICYGMQLLVRALGGQVERATVREYGRMPINVEPSSALFSFLEQKRNFSVWMSHGDEVKTLPSGFSIAAKSASGTIVAAENPTSGIFLVQFHPEVTHTEYGKDFLQHFLLKIAQLKPTWSMSSFAEESIASLAQAVQPGEHVICALSGGVDSCVAATLVHKALGDRLHCIFVDTGLLRYREGERVMQLFNDKLHLPVTCVDAADEFYRLLDRVSDPEEKRKVIGKAFISIFNRCAEGLAGQLGAKPKYLVQGTLYPDVIESSSSQEHQFSSAIKSHHNVGGLPENLPFTLIEPLRDLFKDEVRSLGKTLGVPDDFLLRHPFPGPGLAIRILGEVTEERARTLQLADEIFIKALHEEGIYHQIWQAGAIFLPVRTVGVQGDERTHEHVIALRAVTSHDGMTADWYPFKPEFLATVSNRIINEVSGINRVVYDISSKPPATIEWE